MQGIKNIGKNCFYVFGCRSACRRKIFIGGSKNRLIGRICGKRRRVLRLGRSEKYWYWGVFQIDVDRLFGKHQFRTTAKDCKDCPLKEQCCKPVNYKEIHHSVDKNYYDKAISLLNTRKGKMNRIFLCVRCVNLCVLCGFIFLPQGSQRITQSSLSW